MTSQTPAVATQGVTPVSAAVMGIVQRWLTKHERSQAWLARKAGLNPSWIYLILAGRRKPGPKTLRRLESAMGLSEETLMLSGFLPYETEARDEFPLT